ncbi:MAG TPA: penicillin acylase family protein [Burkholderiaceae bacterium]
MKSVFLRCGRAGRATAVVLLACAWMQASANALPDRPALQKLGVQQQARILTDREGIPHIFAASETDLAYLTGYAQARDRLFQLDTTRRQADGTLAELLGPGALTSDVTLRTIGLRRAAELSLPLASPEVRAALAAYARGINDYAASHPLPREYAALEITRFRPWTEVDSYACLKLFVLPPIDELERTLRLQAYQAAGAANGFNGTALYFDDTDRAQPFDPAATVPDATEPPVRRRGPHWNRSAAQFDARHLDAATMGVAREFMQRVRQTPLARPLLDPSEGDRGSNAFVVSGRFSLSGEPLLVGDPHLPLTVPPFFYQAQLTAPGLDVIGGLFPGIPYVLIGHNDRISFTATNSFLDVIDVYREQLVPDAGSPSGFSSLYDGRKEPVQALPQVFMVNTPGDGTQDNLTRATDAPAAVLIVPRHGPVIEFNASTGAALTLQWTGHSGTREFDYFRLSNRARNLADYSRALDFFDAGQQNFLYADVDGHIAYFLSGEVPLREDLQAGRVVGLPPTFVRNGQGGNEWLRETTPSKDPTRALPFQIITREEMPKLVDPPRGYIVSANNDQTGATRDNDPFNQMRPGGGIFYLGGALYDSGLRAGRIDELLEQAIQRRGRLTTKDLQAIVADTVMGDARFFTPYIVQALDNARRPGADPQLAQFARDPGVVEAVKRLAAWDQSTPTGIRAGYDANDEPGRLREPSDTEVQHSIAATLFSVWRNQFINGTVVAALQRFKLPISSVRRDPSGATRNLLEAFDERQGIGASGLNFFDVPGVADAAARRDIVILRGVADTLAKLAGNEYATAFKRSTDLDDYRWGKLHRVMLDHPLGSPFSIPSVGGTFPPPLAADGLPGIPVDGGMSTVDVAGNTLLRDDPAAFVFRSGPSQRFIARARTNGRGFASEMSLPGGQSGLLGSPFQINLLEQWLTNNAHPLRDTLAELLGNTIGNETILPRR